jgi:tryptophan synthase alpha chain
MTGIQYERQGPIGFMGHLIADYPSPQAAREIIKVMVEAGVDFIEIQIPFSEPVADGPLFLAANHKALSQGVTFAKAQELMRESAQKFPQCQFLYMSYLNPVFCRGYETFCRESAEVGARGMIIPDLPMEEAAKLEGFCKKHNVSKVQLIAPNASDARLDSLCSTAQGLIYAVARAGVTGAETSFGQDVVSFVRRIKKRTQVPVALGFGIKSPEDIHALRDDIDIAVVGSQAMRVFESAGVEALAEFWSSLHAAARD